MLIEGKCLIKDIVHSRSMTQQMLANKSGIDKRTISFYSTGRRTHMPLRVAVTIADVLKCNSTDLYEWKRGEDDLKEMEDYNDMDTKNDSVSNYLLKLVEDRQSLSLRKQGEDKRLTIILSEYDYNRLISIGETLNEKPSVLARNLLTSSLDDAETILREKSL